MASHITSVYRCHHISRKDKCYYGCRLQFGLREKMIVPMVLTFSFSSALEREKTTWGVCPIGYSTNIGWFSNPAIDKQVQSQVSWNYFIEFRKKKVSYLPLSLEVIRQSIHGYFAIIRSFINYYCNCSVTRLTCAHSFAYDVQMITLDPVADASKR